MSYAESVQEPLSRQHLELDCEAAVAEITTAIRDFVLGETRRKGTVVGISGGIDSSVCAALAARALGSERVLGLFTPERESDAETLRLSRLAASSQGIEGLLEDITPLLDAAGCYVRRDRAIASVIPDYTAAWKCKLVLPSVIDDDRYRISSVVAQSPDGRRVEKRLTPAAYFGVVAASNFKQRTRKMLEYYHADRLHYAVIGTPNRLEYDQGFFVKGGDGLADIKPIAHLYKTQVYQLAAHLGVPEEIRRRPPTTDTYSLPQEQDEFYFSLSHEKLDLCLYARNQGYPAGAVAEVIGLTAEQVERVFRDIDQKRRSTRYLHLPPRLAREVHEVNGASAK
jgi:NAD+ synthase